MIIHLKIWRSTYMEYLLNLLNGLWNIISKSGDFNVKLKFFITVSEYSCLFGVNYKSDSKFYVRRHQLTFLTTVLCLSKSGKELKNVYFFSFLTSFRRWDNFWQGSLRNMYFRFCRLVHIIHCKRSYAYGGLWMIHFMDLTGSVIFEKDDLC